MKSKHKENKHSHLTQRTSDSASKNQRDQNMENRRESRDEDRRGLSDSKEKKLRDELAQGYFPDGPGGKFTGI